MIRKQIYMISILLFWLASLGIGHAQTVKQITVEEGVPYVDHVALVEGSKDMDLLVKFTFDEANNSLKVNLISYKKLFVFQDNIRYKKTKRFRKLIPQKLPYVVQVEELTSYKYTKPLRKSIKPKRKHVFKRWITTEGLQPQPTEYKMVNDYIEQKFDILPKRSEVIVRLRDVLVMNEKLKSKNKKRYELFFQTNLNRDYEITIKRNPCFGKEELLLSAQQQRENVEKAFLSMQDKFGPKSGAPSKAKVALFDEMKALMLEQFTYVQEASECPQIQQEIASYNAYVDSITAMKYAYVEKTVARKSAALSMSAETILQMARKIDNAVNRWQLSTDEVEKEDLVNECKSIIQTVSGQINKSMSMSPQQISAVQVFNKAKAYYKKKCEDN